MPYRIIDWVGNVLNHSGKMERPEFAVPLEFEHFDEASDYLSDRFGDLPDDEYEAQLGEFSIVEVKNK